MLGFRFLLPGISPGIDEKINQGKSNKIDTAYSMMYDITGPAHLDSNTKITSENEVILYVEKELIGSDGPQQWAAILAESYILEGLHYQNKQICCGNPPSWLQVKFRAYSALTDSYISNKSIRSGNSSRLVVVSTQNWRYRQTLKRGEI